jgi:hypothetical protein
MNMTPKEVKEIFENPTKELLEEWKMVGELIRNGDTDALVAYMMWSKDLP